MPRLLALALLVFPFPLFAADWPQWRGPNGTGTAEGTLPAKADFLWKLAIPGKGVGSPIVVGEKVYLQTAAADGSSRTLVCLNASDGKQVWTTSHDAATASTHAKGGLAANTPAADSSGVYCVWWDGPTISLRAYEPETRKERWSVSLGKLMSQHGAHYSPVLFSGLVFVNIDQDREAELFAFDAKTGKKVWSAERPVGQASYTIPVLLERKGKRTELIVGSSTGIDSYDPRTGELNWHYTLSWPEGRKPLRMIGAPQFANGLLITNTGDSSGNRYALAIAPVGTGDISRTAPVWKATRDTPYIPGIVARGDYLFWGTDTGLAACAEAKSGRIVWNERVFIKDVSASTLLMDNGLLLVSESGGIATIKATKEFELIEEWTLGEQVIASPASAGGRVYIRGATHMFCYGKK